MNRREKIQRGLARLTDAGRGSRPSVLPTSLMEIRARRARNLLLWLGRALGRAEEWTLDDPNLERHSTQEQWARVGTLAGRYMCLALGEEPAA